MQCQQSSSISKQRQEQFRMDAKRNERRVLLVICQESRDWTLNLGLARDQGVRLETMAVLMNTKYFRNYGRKRKFFISCHTLTSEKTDKVHKYLFKQKRIWTSVIYLNANWNDSRHPIQTTDIFMNLLGNQCSRYINNNFISLRVRNYNVIE